MVPGAGKGRARGGARKDIAERGYLREAGHQQRERGEECIGTAKRFFHERGYGYITPEQGGGRTSSCTVMG